LFLILYISIITNRYLLKLAKRMIIGVNGHLQSVSLIKRKYSKLFLAFVILFINLQIYSQSKHVDPININMNYHYGFNLPEYEFITFLTEDYIRSIDISISRETYGRNMWEQIYNYPEHGISLFYSSLGNNEIFGKELALTYFFKVFLISKDRFRLYNRTGIGLSYVNRVFDTEANYLNVAIASNFNAHFNFRIGVNYEITKKLELNTGGSFDHFSDANMKEPNLGVNYLSSYFGLSCKIGEDIPREFHELKPHERKNIIELFTYIGGKHSRSFSSKYFFTSALSLEINSELFRAFHLGAGLDLFYDSSVKSVLEEKGEDFRNIYDFQSGIHISQTFVYSRFSLSFQEGIYLVLKDKKEDYRYFNRGIIQYRLNEKFSIRLAMKTNLNILDYPEFGIGYKF
jgi:opacity protein-like surface antigen